LVLLFSSVALAPRYRPARVLLAAQLVFASLALTGWRRPGRIPLAGAAWYYTVVNAASVVGLVRTLVRRPYVTWSPTRGGP